MSPLLAEILAQGITPNRILAALNPMNSLWSILAWTVLVLDVLAMLLQKNGSLTLTTVLAIGILSALINILGSNNLGGTGSGGVIDDMLQADNVRFGNWMVIIAMMSAPLIFAGMTKTGRSRLPAIIAFVVAAGYLFFKYATMPK